MFAKGIKPIQYYLSLIMQHFSALDHIIGITFNREFIW